MVCPCASSPLILRTGGDAGDAYVHLPFTNLKPTSWTLHLDGMRAPPDTIRPPSHVLMPCCILCTMLVMSEEPVLSMVSRSISSTKMRAARINSMLVKGGVTFTT